MAYTLKSPYTYTDYCGHVYPTTTHTSQEPCVSGETQEYTLQEGGDHTNCTKKVIGAPTSWPAQMVR